MSPTTPGERESWDGESWEDDRVSRWLAQAEALDRQLAPVSALLFDAAALAPGERVIDIGCGHGPTTRRAAALVGPGGSVTGVDISEEMLAAAARVEPPAGSASLNWLVADVGAWVPTSPIVDVAISRFGVMFFEDPAAAFANIASAVEPGGRLAMATWDRRDLNEVFDLGYRVAAGIVEAHGLIAPEVPVDRGPYSLPDSVRIVPLLAAAGWSEIEVVHHDISLLAGGGADPRAAADAGLDLGPARFVAAEHPGHREEIRDALAKSFAERVDADGRVVLAGRVAMTTARRRDR